MPKIKEKETNSKTIRYLDCSNNIDQRTKKSYQCIKEKNDQTQANESGVDEYSVDCLESGMSSLYHSLFNFFDKKVVSMLLKQKKILLLQG